MQKKLTLLRVGAFPEELKLRPTSRCANEAAKGLDAQSIAKRS